jgi:hypothetical protein
MVCTFLVVYMEIIRPEDIAIVASMVRVGLALFDHGYPSLITVELVPDLNSIVIPQTPGENLITAIDSGCFNKS